MEDLRDEQAHPGHLHQYREPARHPAGEYARQQQEPPGVARHFEYINDGRGARKRRKRRNRRRARPQRGERGCKAQAVTEGIGAAADQQQGVEHHKPECREAVGDGC